MGIAKLWKGRCTRKGHTVSSWCRTPPQGFNGNCPRGQATFLTRIYDLQRENVLIHMLANFARLVHEFMPFSGSWGQMSPLNEMCGHAHLSNVSGIEYEYGPQSPATALLWPYSMFPTSSVPWKSYSIWPINHQITCSVATYLLQSP